MLFYSCRSFIKVMIENRLALEITILIWIVVGLSYITFTPANVRTHDFQGNFNYSKYIASKKKLPKPYEWEQSYQPPLYYLVNSFISPNSLQADSPEKIVHVNYVRFLSFIYGGITLLILGLFLKHTDIGSHLKFLLLLFTATTPNFLFIFSTYNNDSLSTLLCVAILAVSYKLHHKYSFKFASLLLLNSLAALYTSYESLWCVSIAIFICLKNLVILKLPSRNDLRIISILILSVSLLFPWLYFHNFKNTKRFFPTNIDSKIVSPFNLSVRTKTILKIFKIPVLQQEKREWDEPWVYPIIKTKKDINIHPSTKSYDYISYSFITSLIGQYKFIKPQVQLIWALLLIHFVLVIFCIKESLKSDITKVSLFLIIFSHIAQLIVVSLNKFPELGLDIDYRHISWNCIGWVILYSEVFKTKQKWFLNIVIFLMILAVITHLVVIFNTKGGSVY